MKKLNTILSAACLLAIIVAGCGNHGKDGKQKADSANSQVDSTSKVYPNTDRQISKPDAEFAVEAANGGMSEVALGTLAQQKAASADVKAFGAMMVTDHTMANNEMKKIAAAKFITLPDSVGGAEKKLAADLSVKTGTNFDKAYVEAMVKDHKEDIAAFEEASKKVTYPELQAFISKTLPVLHKHLDAIQKIQVKMK